MRKKKLAGISLGIVAALTIAGCSSGGTSDDGTVTLQMVESLTSPKRTEVIKGLIDQFEKENKDIKVELISPPTDQADQKIQQMLQSGSGVDVLEVRDITVGPFSTNGWLSDMTTDLADWKGWDNLTDNAVKYSKDAEGHTYYVPYGFYGLSLFYRTDLVKAAGFDGPPKTWDDMLKQASKIQDPVKNQYGYAFRGGTNANSNVVAVIEAYVADNLDTENAFKLTNGKTIFSAPEAKDALNTYFDIFKKASPPSSVAWGYPEMVEAFSNGSTAFLLQDPEVISAIEGSDSLKADQWSTTPLLEGPTGKAAQPMASAGWGIAAASEHKAEATKLIEFLSEGDAPVTFAQENSLVPILKDAADSDFYKTGPWSSYVTMNENPDTYISVVQPRGSAWWSEWIQKADSEIQQVLIGKMSNEDLLKSWDTYWTDKWAGK